ncbi:hypothetical protein JH06_3736 [Blastocystis sp. subtype 4]|uniref:hypothetical protein n=1 Tax=Blastocystis sp. subtype 4 TaxID=944170 RepID=UPI0007119AD3|nr:hypothetical protein JH06_3736 [Blastocystis sp. subtype 4]KNB42707.1 hypothetical protein JH06_3736 [Blastocystis sp. subtype 4]|eukprot:XP_014526150.1 hypothetical protein JH06_3736 [Blastocystis sp. subtype 4]
MNYMTSEIMEEIKALPGNDRCADCGEEKPVWASISYGSLICLKCSGLHRGLGVHLSFVRSLELDTWSENEIKAMKMGGNKQMIDFFEKHNIPSEVPVSVKYTTETATLYRSIIKAKVDGTEVPEDHPLDEDEQNKTLTLRKRESQESSIEQDRRLREEAEKRLNEKFGKEVVFEVVTLCERNV